MNKARFLNRTAIAGLPDELLSDALLILGKRGSGKSYFQRMAFERALAKGLRCGWIDAMGIGWGITVAGNPSNLKKPISAGYDVVIFGGKHAHIPITENSGAALGAQLARATFSWVIDIKELPSKASRVRFMLAFCEALYEHCQSQLLLFIDETDLWAPQQLGLKGGPEALLLGAMDEIVRRGRVLGLVPWMASQRSAEVNMKIRSQADALITFKLTAPHDIEAATDWIEKHVGKKAAQEWGSQMPALKPGEAIVYITEPSMKVYRKQFPLIETLDTMSPKETGTADIHFKNAAKPNLDAIRQQLGILETELQANDPKFLKAEVARLTKTLSKIMDKASHPPKLEAVDTKAIRLEAFQEGVAAGQKQGNRARDAARKIVTQFKADLAALEGALEGLGDAPLPTMRETPAPVITVAPVKVIRPSPGHVKDSPGDLKKPQQRILDAVAWWKSTGIDSPTMAQVAGAARYAVGGNFNTLCSSLTVGGYLERPAPGTLSLTTSGLTNANQPDTPGSLDEIQRRVREILKAPQQKIFNALLDAMPNDISMPDLATASGYQVGGNFNTLVSSLSVREILVRPRPGYVRAAEWLCQ